MADDAKAKREERLRRDIAEIASRPKQVRFDEIENIVNRLGEFMEVGSRTIRHGTLFTVGKERFSVVPHNRGDSHLKRVYVKVFLEAMTRLSWCEDQDDDDK
jgi:hypothetical protein